MISFRVVTGYAEYQIKDSNGFVITDWTRLTEVSPRDQLVYTDGLFGSEAIAVQIEKTQMWIDLYRRQGRTQDKIDYEQNRLDELLKLV